MLCTLCLTVCQLYIHKNVNVADRLRNRLTSLLSLPPLHLIIGVSSRKHGGTEDISKPPLSMIASVAQVMPPYRGGGCCVRRNRPRAIGRPQHQPSPNAEKKHQDPKSLPASPRLGPATSVTQRYRKCSSAAWNTRSAYASRFHCVCAWFEARHEPAINRRALSSRPGLAV